MDHLTTLLFLAICGLVTSTDLAGGYTYEPDCSTCSYYNGVGYVEDPYDCCSYYMCVRNPYYYEYVDEVGKGGHYPSYVEEFTIHHMCCDHQLVWDPYVLTCVYPGALTYKRYCNMCNYYYFEYSCPNSYYEYGDCPYLPSHGYPRQYVVAYTGDYMQCAFGTYWSQDDCACVNDGSTHYDCDKIIHFEFNYNYFYYPYDYTPYDSFSCNNFVKGDPYGDVYITNDDQLYLDGSGGFLSFNYLNNWFVRNPQAQLFTFSWQFQPSYYYYSGGILSTNCYYDYYYEYSVLEANLYDGYLVLAFAEFRIYPVEVYPGVLYEVFVGFDYGTYKVEVYEHTIYGPYLLYSSYYYSYYYYTAINSHSHTTIGYSEYAGTFDGYIDNVCFYTDFFFPYVSYE